MEDKSKWVIAVVVLAALVLVGGACVCGGFGYLVSNAPEQDQANEQAQDEGQRDGQRGSAEDCVREGHARAAVCGEIGFGCQVSAQEYLRACLRVAPPSDTLCVGAPARPGLLTDEAFSVQLCESRGWRADTIVCNAVAEAVETHCAARAR